MTDFIPEYGQVSADEFAEWVMLADDCGPEANLRFRDRHKHDIGIAFIRYMGAEIVPAQDLRYDAEI
ncbi:hypothetical protein [Parasulfitobacter algicola]|uniref:Uncharacterized protein n=1 Tax=Parasulfitobacter algicola TaxID=2614809 RepID=A0ABX2IUD9_9RHOB|nr:hypothetical protein [Sulfitobacter algicola]NSX56519.1 hypothetical protein [Sulfitobacter algicola]